MSPTPEILAGLCNLLRQLRDGAAAADESTQRGEPAVEHLALLERLAAASGERVAQLAAAHGPGRAALPGDSARALAEARELLEESLRRLQSAWQYAKVSLDEVARRLEESALREKGSRAYQAHSAR